MSDLPREAWGEEEVEAWIVDQFLREDMHNDTADLLLDLVRSREKYKAIVRDFETGEWSGIVQELHALKDTCAQMSARLSELATSPGPPGDCEHGVPLRWVCGDCDGG